MMSVSASRSGTAAALEKFGRVVEAARAIREIVVNEHSDVERDHDGGEDHVGDGVLHARLSS